MGLAYLPTLTVDINKLIVGKCNIYAYQYMDSSGILWYLSSGEGMCPEMAWFCFEDPLSQF